MKGRLGAQAAVTATAHKLARIVYLALKHGMTYVRQSQEDYEAQMKEKQIKALRRKARQLGLEVVEKPSVSGASAAAEPVQGLSRTRGDQRQWATRQRGATGKRKTSRSDSSLAATGERARPGEPGRETASVRWASWLREVPCNGCVEPESD
jgi:hypothetical protein